MAKTSTLGSPGIEVIETDSNSARTVTTTACTVLVPGFASQGPVEEIVTIGDMNDFEDVFGTPTNAAERYFYYSVKALVNGSGNGTTIYACRLPYGVGDGDNTSDAYTLLAYPAIPVVKNSDVTSPYYTSNETELKEFFNLYINDTQTRRSYFKAADASVTVSNTLDKTKADIEEATAVTDSALIGQLDALYSFFSEEGHVFDDKDQETAFSGDQKFIKIDTGKTEKRTYNVTVTVTSGTTKNVYSFKTTGDEAISSNSALYKILVSYCEENEITTSTDNVEITVPVVRYYYVKADAASGYTLTPSAVTSFYLDRVDENSSSNSISTTQLKTGSFDIEEGNIISNSSDSNITGAVTIKSIADTDSQDKKLATFEIVGSNKILKIVFSATFTYLIDSDVVHTASSGKQAQFNSSITTTFTKQSLYKEDHTSDDESKTYIIGSPVTFKISADEYEGIKSGDITWDGISSKIQKITGATVAESIKKSAFVIINKSRSTVNSSFEGYYLGMCDNMFISPSDDYTYNAIRSIKTITTDDQDDYDDLNTNKLNFYLDTNYQGSVSRIMERGITNLDISGSQYDDTLSFGLFKLAKTSSTDDSLKLSYSLREKYNTSLGSTRKKTQQGSTKSVPYFAESVMEDSSNIEILVNPEISKSILVDADGNLKGKVRVLSDKLTNNLTLFKEKYIGDLGYTKLSEISKATKKSTVIESVKSSLDTYRKLVEQAGVDTSFLSDVTMSNADSLYQFGVYKESIISDKKIIGNVPSKIERALQLVSNDEEYPNLDLVIEAGLGTVYAYSNKNAIDGDTSGIISCDSNNNMTEDYIADQYHNFIDSINLVGIEDLRTSQSVSDYAQSVIDDFVSVQEAFLTLAATEKNGGRGSTYYIGDILRGIVVKGKNTKVQNLFGKTLVVNSIYSSTDKVYNSWTTSVYNAIKNSTENITSNCMGCFAQWLKADDAFSGEKVWLPASGFVGALRASCDETNGAWYASAGINRGVISGVVDYAITPTLSQRTDLYKICVNSIPKIPNSGITVWGIRTMGRKDTAFDQDTCRRTFMYIEKVLKRYLRNYLFEPNTAYTRLRILNDIEPFMEGLYNAGAIYNYTVVCDTTNNTADIINNGDLAVDISAAPTRTAENIVLSLSAEKLTETVISTLSL